MRWDSWDALGAGKWVRMEIVGGPMAKEGQSLIG